MRLGVSGQLLSQTHSLSEIVDVLQSLDVDAIELWPRNVPGGDGPEEEQRYEKKDVAGTRRLLTSAGWRSPASHSDSGFSRSARKPAQATAPRRSGRGRCGGKPWRSIVNCYLAGIALSSSWRRRSRRLSTRVAPA